MRWTGAVNDGWLAKFHHQQWSTSEFIFSIFETEDASDTRCGSAHMAAISPDYRMAWTIAR
jgi:hypothetical protein